MSESNHDSGKSEKDALAIGQRVVEIIQLALGVSGVLTALVISFEKQPWIFFIGLSVALGSMVSFAVRRWRKRHAPVPHPPVNLPPTNRAFLRGLLPFEQGERLLGRDRDIKQISAKVASTEFRFGYLSGEAGVGKTSLLRSGVIPELAKSGWLVLYVNRLGVDPRKAMLKALKQNLGAEPKVDESRPLHDLVAETARQNSGKKILIVFDQFEEFFISHRTAADREPFLEEIGATSADQDLPIAFLISLRKEFVDDLQDFRKYIPQPLDSRFSYRLRNWETDEALGVFNAAAAQDQIPFSEALREAVIRDLGQAGEVRPVEFQLVASHLIDQRIYELDRYREAKGALGILASYIRTKFEPLGPGTPELERQIARHLLRALCSKNLDAKRPTGLSFDELAQRIQAVFAESGSANMMPSSEEFRSALNGVVERLHAGYLIIQEDEEKYNLIHDYIVRPILDATGDIDTVEEQANRILDQYLEDQRRNPKATIPRRQLRFILKYASPRNKMEAAAARLIARTRRQYAVRKAGVITAILVFTIGVSRPRIVPIVRPFTVENHTRWIISADRSIAISFKKNDRSYIWHTATPWDSRRSVDINFDNMYISPKSTYIAGITQDGKLYVWQAWDEVPSETNPVLVLGPEKRDLFAILIPTLSTGLPMSQSFSNEYLNHFIGFSPDERWVYVISPERKLYVWHPEGHLPDVPEVLLDFVEASSSLLPAMPKLAFSPDGNYLAAVDSDDSLRIFHLGMSSLNPYKPNQKAYNKGFGSKGVSFSKDSNWVTFHAADDYIYMAALTAFPRLVFVKLPIKRAQNNFQRYSAFDTLFSPDNKWLVAEAAFEDLHIWRVEGAVETAIFPKLPPGNLLSVSYDVEFGGDGEWIAGITRDGALYIVRLGESSSLDIKPSIPSPEKASVMKFSPRGNWIAGGTKSGRVYVWKPGDSPDILRPVAHHATSGKIGIFWCADDKHVFTLGGSDVYWGEAGKSLGLLARKTTNVVDIAETPGHVDIVFFGENDLAFVKRQLVLFGIPLYTYKWPALAHETLTR